MAMVKAGPISKEMTEAAEAAQTNALPSIYTEGLNNCEKILSELVFNKICPWAEKAAKPAYDFISGTKRVSVVPVSIVKRPLSGGFVEFKIDRFCSPDVFVMIGISQDRCKYYSLGFIDAKEFHKSAIRKADDVFTISINELIRLPMDESIIGNRCRFVTSYGVQCKRAHSMQIIVGGTDQKVCAQHSKIMDWMNTTGRLNFVD